MNDELFQFLLDDSTHEPWTVTELNAKVRGALERQFANVWVEGEVVNFVQASSGHWYFNLNDGTSQVKCVCWKGTNYRIRFKPQNGIVVRVRGRMAVYEARGELQLSVESLEPSGEGALAAAYEQIRSKLEKEGLFSKELKREIPSFPRRVAVVTSRTGAAYHDILTVLTRRAKSVSILLVPALVQGEGAADSIRRAVAAVNKYDRSLDESEKIDVLIVGRGGGSAEDLWAFNDESLARALRSSEIPVISAIGHEIDWTIADLVSDLRAATPSAAAEIVANREEDILYRLESVEATIASILDHRLLIATSSLNDSASRLQYSFSSSIQRFRSRFADLASRLSPSDLQAKTAMHQNAIARLEQRKNSAINGIIASKNEEMRVNIAKLDVLSPLAVLTRGYSIVQGENGKVLRDAAETKSGDKLKIRLENGKLDAQVL